MKSGKLLNKEGCLLHIIYNESLGRRATSLVISLQALFYLYKKGTVFVVIWEFLRRLIDKIEKMH